jgi:hypothetical protein
MTCTMDRRWYINRHADSAALMEVHDLYSAGCRLESFTETSASLMAIFYNVPFLSLSYSTAGIDLVI